jgi:hypothetical protein
MIRMSRLWGIRSVYSAPKSRYRDFSRCNERPKGGMESTPLHPPFNDSNCRLANFDRDFPGGRVLVEDVNLVSAVFQKSIGDGNLSNPTGEVWFDRSA